MQIKHGAVSAYQASLYWLYWAKGVVAFANVNLYNILFLERFANCLYCLLAYCSQDFEFEQTHGLQTEICSVFYIFYFKSWHRIVESLNSSGICIHRSQIYFIDTILFFHLYICSLKCNSIQRVYCKIGKEKRFLFLPKTFLCFGYSEQIKNVIHMSFGIEAKLVLNTEKSMLPKQQIFCRKRIPMLTGWKMSSVACQCVFYRPEYNAKGGSPWN